MQDQCMQLKQHQVKTMLYSVEDSFISNIIIYDAIKLYIILYISLYCVLKKVFVAYNDYIFPYSWC